MTIWRQSLVKAGNFDGGLRELEAQLPLHQVPERVPHSTSTFERSESRGLGARRDSAFKF